LYVDTYQRSGHLVEQVKHSLSPDDEAAEIPPGTNWGGPSP
jgi:hypothetical protein